MQIHVRPPRVVERGTGPEHASIHPW
jgi:hypothetical protein